MIRRALVGLVVLASIVTSNSWAPTSAEGATKRPDLAGRWRLDRELTNSMRSLGGEREGQGPGGGGGGGRGGPPGGGFGGGGPGGPPDGAGGAPSQGGRKSGAGPSPSALPDLVRVAQTEQVLSFADSAGTVRQEIALPTREPGAVAHAVGARVFKGKWKGKKLEAQFTEPGGMKLTQTMTLAERGEVLVVTSKMGSSGGMPPREDRIYYRRARAE
jgi:hypothetical protein